jgi:glycosyltransferase involved in cell wall biosynthesis
MINIVMPIYNGIEFIKESVDSILNQTFQNWVLIIGINGHLERSDVYKTAKKMENDKRIRVYDMHDIKGKSNALNEMMKYCEYDWISILDVDDIWLPNKLEKQLPYMETYDVIGTKCKYFGDLQAVPNIPVLNISNENFFASNPIINSSSMIKKELCYWKQENEGVEDYDMWIRLWKQHKQFYNINEILVLHRIHRSSAFNANGNNNNVKKLLQDHMKTI